MGTPVLFDNPEEEQDSTPTEATSKEPLESVEQPEPDLEQAEDVPEKYRGKSLAEVARMHQEVEKRLSAQGNEVGELRRTVDAFIQSQTLKQQQETETEDEDVDFYTDPDKAVERAVSRHPKVQKAEQLATAMERQEALNTFQRNHPDFQEIACR